MTLAHWYEEHGRHELPWRLTRDRWSVLVSEVMLHQTQVPRVAAVYDDFLARFPTPAAMVGAGPGAVIEAWGRLGYPRRARRLYDTAVLIAEHGWPSDLATLPGIGRYTAAAVAVQADGVDVPAIEVNIRRVVERVVGARLGARAAEEESVRVGRPLRGRDRLLALMDVGALVCKPRVPRCAECPLRRRCATRGPLDGEGRARQAPFAGSFRQRRGVVMARLRSGSGSGRGAGSVAVAELDGEALASLVEDGLAVVVRGRARLPSS